MNKKELIFQPLLKDNTVKCTTKCNVYMFFFYYGFKCVFSLKCENNSDVNTYNGLKL